MPELLGFGVSMEVDGIKLNEYGVQVDKDKKTATCWVPSEAGKSFHVVVNSPEARKKHHTIILCLDGHPPTTSTLLKADNPQTVVRLAKEWVSTTSTRDFQFSTLTLTDDDTYLHSASDKIGEILCKIFSVERLVKISSAPQVAAPAPAQSTTRVHEKAKKGLAHCVKYGAEEKVVTPPEWHNSVGTRLIASFVFKYRNMDILVADGIAPRVAASGAKHNRSPLAESTQGRTTSKPSSKVNKRTIETVKQEEDDDEEDDVVLGEEERALEARLAEIKAKRSKKKKPESVKRLKKEHKPAFIPGEVIDLT